MEIVPNKWRPPRWKLMLALISIFTCVYLVCIVTPSERDFRLLPPPIKGTVQMPESHTPLASTPEILSNTSSVIANQLTMDEWLEIQAERSARVKAVCREMNNASMFKGHFLTRDSNLVDAEHKFVYCSIPKTGCTSWLNLILAQTGRSKLYKGEMVHERHVLRRAGIKQLTSLQPPERRHEVVRSYTKFLVVRDPYQRLVSAYRNKIEHTNISKPFLRNPMRHAKNIYKMYGDEKTDKSLGKSPKVLFDQFIKYATDGDKRYYNNHWGKYHELCPICHFNYYIVKFETLEQDIHFLLKIIYGLDNGEKLFPHLQVHGTTSDNVADDYMELLSKEDRRKINKAYKWDFKLFDYNLI